VTQFDRKWTVAIVCFAENRGLVADFASTGESQENPLKIGAFTKQLLKQKYDIDIGDMKWKVRIKVVEHNISDLSVSSWAYIQAFLFCDEGVFARRCEVEVDLSPEARFKFKRALEWLIMHIRNYDPNS
jgi:hypothetical protein